MSHEISRRGFIAAAAGAAAVVGASSTGGAAAAASDKPALLGGKPVRTEPFPAWPVFDASEERALVDTLRTGQWFRGSGDRVATFESAFTRLLGAKYCVATSSGTNALIMSLNALGVGAGDEVILPPYTFVACVNAVLMLGALPIFVDTDPKSFQIDATKIEAAISDRTAAIMPIHIGGDAVDVDAILTLARKHKIPVVEDACQAHLGEWKGRKLGTFGDAGCFSFQASKNLTAGEGGAVVTNDESLADRVYAAQTNGRSRRKGANVIRGSNVRMSEFHASILLAQIKRVDGQAKLRDENAEHLTKLLSEIPGVTPASRYAGCTRSAHHLYMLRYDREHFAGLGRDAFLKALKAEGIPASGGYTPLNKEPFIAETIASRGYRRSFPPESLASWPQRTACPVNDNLCREAVWFTQNMLLADKNAMGKIAEAVRRVQSNAAELARRQAKL
jgi:dTDP-4-amino-4,6-dideoxygalactose transaminase